MTKEQAEKVLNELQGVRPEMLNGEAKRLFEAIMKIADERDELKKKDKIIDELEYIFYNYQLCEYELTDCTYRKCEYIADDEIPPCKECIKQYFENKAKEK